MRLETLASHPQAVSRRHKGIFSVFTKLDALYRQRRALDRLDAHLRRDVGLSDTDINNEVNRPVWDIPAWWQ